MPHLVHNAPLAEARKIRRNGIRARKIRGCEIIFDIAKLPAHVTIPELDIVPTTL